MARSERVRRALELMGELESRTTRDEAAEGWGEPDPAEMERGSRDDELRRDVPPHHGD